MEHTELTNIIPPPMPPLAPTTTHQEDMTLFGQRRINLVWECTQAFIAVIVTSATMIVGSWIGIYAPLQQVPTILSVAFGTVIGFYFARTNHQAIGGTGPKPFEKYQGR